MRFWCVVIFLIAYCTSLRGNEAVEGRPKLDNLVSSIQSVLLDELSGDTSLELRQSLITVLSQISDQNILSRDFDAPERVLSSSTEPVFGSLSRMNNKQGILSILIIVGLVLAFEHFFLIVKEITQDTPFENIVIAIKNEMMIG